MKIAFTHNLQVEKTEEQAEFDTPETINRLADAMRRLGHEVHLVDVTGPASRLVARLESLKPDLVFNTAEGSHGRYREAFYPALFEQLRLPFTGSDAYTCAITLDKQASKLMLASRGVQTPKWAFVSNEEDSWAEAGLRFPIIVKPNFEGSSKGITQASIVEDETALAALVEELLPRYESGLLLEEFIEGRDVTVPYLESYGVLPPASYRFDTSDRRWDIYDYELKNEKSDSVSVETPADVTDAVRQKLESTTQEVVNALGIRDLARVDFRLTEYDEIFFIEVNALPSLEPGASLYESAKLVGIETVEDALDRVIQSAIERQGIEPRETPETLSVGLAYNLKRVDPRSGSDVDAEFDSPATISAIRQALEANGHDVIELEATPDLLHVLPATDVDVVFNIAEGLRGRNRESQVPAILELLDIEYTGSDPATLSITLDKGLAKRLVREAGLATPKSALVRVPDDVGALDLRYPLIIKPNAEGSSKGVTSASVCKSPEELRERVAEMTRHYQQALLVEEFLTGREFTIAVLGDLEPRALPPMEIVFSDEAGELPVYTFGHKIETEKGVRYEAPAQVDSALAKALSDHALRVFDTLGCRDVARIDVRLDADGVPNFIECNPLPGLTPDWSDICQIATAAGIDYTSLIGRILAPALRRHAAKKVDS